MSQLKRVLIADNDAYWRQCFSDLCRTFGVEVTEVSDWSGLRSVAKSARQSGNGFDGLIFDLGLEMDPTESLNELRDVLTDWQVRSLVATGSFDSGGKLSKIALEIPGVSCFVKKVGFFNSFENIVEFFRANVSSEVVKRVISERSLRPLNEGDIAPMQKNKKSVFVIHGQDENARRGVFEFLRSINLLPVEWGKAVEMTGNPAAVVKDVLEVALKECAAVIAILTGDEIIQLRPELRKPAVGKLVIPKSEQARPNVFIEIGMALAILPGRLIIVEIGESKIPSDLDGMHRVRLDNSAEKRNELARRLKMCGCEVELRGSDWLTTGDLKRT